MKPTIENPDSPLMTRKEAAEYLRVSYVHFGRLDVVGIRIGRRIRYTKEMLDHYMQTNLRRPDNPEERKWHENTDTSSVLKTARSGTLTLPFVGGEFASRVKQLTQETRKASH